MKKRTLKQFINRNFAITIFSFNIIIGLAFSLIVRNYFVEKNKNEIYNSIELSVNQINNQLYANFQKMSFLSEIVLSQINNPRAFYDLNSTFKTIMSSEPNINKTFITLAVNKRIYEDDLFNLIDSLGQLDITWSKNIDNVVFLDSINASSNSYYFETLKNNPQIYVFNANSINQIKDIVITKPIVFPLFEGNTFIGIFGFDLNTNFISDILTKNELSQNTFVIDESGIILYNQSKNIYLGQPFTFLIRDNFANKEADIIKNKEFYELKNGKVLFFTPFTTQFGSTWKMGTFVDAKLIYQKANTYFIVIIVLFVVLAIVTLVFFTQFVEKISGFVTNINSQIADINKGKLKKTLNLETSVNEIDTIIENIEQMRQRLNRLVQIHNQIKTQHIETTLEPLSDEDIIAVSINEATDAIVDRQKSRQETVEQQRRAEWISDGLNVLHEATRVTEHRKIEDLTDQINKSISVYSNSFLTSIYLIENINNEQKLRAVSTFGLNTKYAFNKEINLGEGIIGTVALERKTQYYKVVPDDYEVIVTGLAEMKPKSILVQPLEYEKEFFGILEIAFLRNLEQYEIDFFTLASSEIALSIKNLLNNISNADLVEQMRKQKEEIEKAQILLQEKIKESQQNEKESTEREAIMRSMINAINNTLITIEYTTKGILLNANNNYLKISGYTLEEIRGINVLELVKSERKELEEVINRVAVGESVEKLMKRFTKFGEVRWFFSTYTPYYDANGNITKVIYFAFDLTEIKKHSEKLEKEISLMKKQVKILREKL